MCEQIHFQPTLRAAQVAICHAKLVARLIALSHSEIREVSIAGGQVLKALSMS